MRVLLIDTCGDRGSVALAQNATIVTVEDLPARAASSALLPTIHRLLEASGWDLSTLEGVGVVSGPGSFTGVRVGLAAAKGLCEARGLPLATVSRLEALAEAAKLQHGWAVLDAGRGELYVRCVGMNGMGESLMRLDDLLRMVQGERVIVAEERLMPLLAEVRPELHDMHVTAVLLLSLRRFQQGGDDLECVDANYVRGENEIYRKQLERNVEGPAV